MFMYPIGFFPIESERLLTYGRFVFELVQKQVYYTEYVVTHSYY